VKNYFTGDVARHYDEDIKYLYDPSVIDPVVAFLEQLAGKGPVLELGIGTGRLALPLSQRGLQVSGIELSPEMVEELRKKPGSEVIDVTMGDFATAEVGRRFTLAYLIFNTITNLTSQEEQLQCFQNVAEHLEPGGYFVVEVFVPQLRSLPPKQSVVGHVVTATALDFDVYDVANQGVVSYHYRDRGDGLEVFAAPFRYVWPSELDLMARLAGMTLSGRWSDWTRRAFTSESHSHVSVWQSHR
jgi:SAM-dependent methyltransferase